MKQGLDHMNNLETHIAIFPFRGSVDSEIVSVLSPAPQCGLTFEEILERSIPKESPRFLVHRDELPEGGLIFQEAWRANYEIHELNVDMTTAQNIAKDMLRNLRAPYFEKLDVLYMRASEAENRSSMSTIVEGKQYLRDITDDSRIKKAGTTGDLLKALKNIEEELEHLTRNSVKEAVGE